MRNGRFVLPVGDEAAIPIRYTVGKRSGTSSIRKPLPIQGQANSTYFCWYQEEEPPSVNSEYVFTLFKYHRKLKSIIISVTWTLALVLYFCNTYVLFIHMWESNQIKQYFEYRVSSIEAIHNFRLMWQKYLQLKKCFQRKLYMNFTNTSYFIYLNFILNRLRYSLLLYTHTSNWKQ